MGFIEIFGSLKDPRIDRTKKHPFLSIIFLTISAVVAGSDTFTDIEEFGYLKEDWLKKYADFPHGIPSHDTIGDLFARLDPVRFSECFTRWVSQVCGVTEQELIHIDGKTLRGSGNKHSGKPALHLVHAYASSAEILLGQLATAEKSNEITAIPELLDAINITGAMVTIDAMGCQKAIASRIVDKGGDYLLSVKSNQKSLEEEIKSAFLRAQPSTSHTESTKDHGRIEERSCAVIDNLGFVDEAVHWKGIKTIIRINCRRHELSSGKQSEEEQYYICSRQLDAKTVSRYVRSHWTIENKLHWVLDVNFNEDLSMIRKGHADNNFALIRRIALNMLKLDTSIKKSINIKRHRAAWSETYLQEILKI